MEGEAGTQPDHTRRSSYHPRSNDRTYTGSIILSRGDGPAYSESSRSIRYQTRAISQRARSSDQLRGGGALCMCPLCVVLPTAVIYVRPADNPLPFTSLSLSVPLSVAGTRDTSGDRQPLHCPHETLRSPINKSLSLIHI